MNKYWHGLAQSSIFFNLLCFSAAVSAQQIIVMSNTRTDLPMKIESTNIENQGYVWQLEITPNPNSNQPQVKLLNPHTTLRLLNNRAIEIGKQITLNQLPKVKNNFKNKLLSLDEENIALTSYYYGKYTLFIKFPESIQYAIKPNFAQLQHQLEPFCPKTDPESQTKSTDSKDHILIDVRFAVDASGTIQNISYVQQVNTQIRAVLDPLLRKIRFQPHNVYGLPKAFSIQQPIVIQCD